MNRKNTEVMSKMVLVKKATLNGVELDCWVKPKQEDNSEFWATREQIGRLLGYSDPMRAIAHIHERNQARLDKFSSVVRLSTVEGNRDVARELTVYNFKGLLEICRYSNQPKADAVMDFLWEIADEIRRTGRYESKKSYMQLRQDYCKLQEEHSKIEEQYNLLFAAYQSMLPDGTESSSQLTESDLTGSSLELLRDGKQVKDISMGDMAKILTDQGTRLITRRVLFAWLRDKGWLSIEEETWNLPTPKSKDLNLFVVRGGYKKDLQAHKPYPYPQIRVTVQGVEFFLSLLARGETFSSCGITLVTRAKGVC